MKFKDIELRTFKKSDLLSLQKSINYREIERFTLRIPYPYTKKHAISWIEECIKNNRKKNKSRINFAIVRNENILGGIGLNHIENYNCEIGYWLTPEEWKKGIATNSVKKLLIYAKKNFRIKKVYAQVIDGNQASIRVLQKCGFKLEGILKNHVFKHNNFHNVYFMAKFL